MAPQRALRRHLTPRRAAAALAIAAGVLVWLVTTEVFPYHSVNHDEAVYLQQAELLLEGQLRLYPPVEEAFRPWFFVDDGAGLYPKYQPVTAVVFAAGSLLGSFRVALPLVAAATVGLTYATVAELFDRRTGVVAAALLLASPLFVVQAGVFLPYVPTMALNLLFAWAYLRADRTGDRRFAALAGLAAGTAFFARPYTAVLFATPFVAHALWTLREPDRETVLRHATTAVLGLLGVAISLGYNAVVTGDPLTFPYQAFAPLDGLGFGRRALLAYETVYTPELALEALAATVRTYVTRWSVAAPLGVVLALGGLGYLLRARERIDGRCLALAGLFLSIPLGEAYFWGTMNVLGDLSEPGDGLGAFLGPYYHIGLLVPTATFAAYALVRIGRQMATAWEAADTRPVRVAVALAVVSATLLGGGLAAQAVADPLADNAEVTAYYDTAYEPFESRTLEHSVVYLPPTYGEWLNHPFQRLRNDPGFDGPVLYALNTREMAVAEAFPDRNLYRYSVGGGWAPRTGGSPAPRLQPVDRVRGERVTLSVAAGVPRFAELVSVRVASEDGTAYATASDPGSELRLDVHLADDTAQVTSPGFDETIAVALPDRGTLRLELLVDFGTTSSYTYDVALPVDRQGDAVRALSPRVGVCDRPSDCRTRTGSVAGTTGDAVRLDTVLRSGEKSDGSR